MKSNYVEYGLKLTLVCAICMVGVAGAYVMARERIEEGKQAAFRAAIREVLSLPADAADPAPLNPDDPEEDQVFVAELDGAKRYAAVGGHQGWSSIVTVAVGAQKDESGDLRIIDVRVISQNETPGLGTRIALEETNLTLWSKTGKVMGADIEEETDWFFLKRYRGKAADNLLLTGDPAEAEERVLKITGVTISSNAATEAVKKALSKIAERAP
jgi:RnfABCDGE-type electron transport complex G subunit